MKTEAWLYDRILEAAYKTAAKKQKEWELAKARQDHMIIDAFKTHTSLPDNYWKEEHHKRMEYITALQFVAAITEDENV